MTVFNRTADRIGHHHSLSKAHTLTVQRAVPINHQTNLNDCVRSTTRRQLTMKNQLESFFMLWSLKEMRGFLGFLHQPAAPQTGKKRGNNDEARARDSRRYRSNGDRGSRSRTLMTRKPARCWTASLRATSLNGTRSGSKNHCVRLLPISLEFCTFVHSASRDCWNGMKN